MCCSIRPQIKITKQNYATPLLVLAGGFGTRLHSVVGSKPKALAPVDGKPFLYLQIEHWIGQGIGSFVFLLHYQADLIIEFLQNEQNGLLAGYQVKYLVEPVPMGTGGAVAYAVEQLQIEGDFLIANADTWLGSGIQQIMQVQSPAMLVLEVEDAGRYGNVIFDSEEYIITFSEKSVGIGTGWINSGLCLVSAEFFKNWDHRAFSLELVTLPKLAQEGTFKAVPIEESFIDIGIPDDYFRFCHWVESGKIEDF